MKVFERARDRFVARVFPRSYESVVVAAVVTAQCAYGAPSVEFDEIVVAVGFNPAVVARALNRAEDRGLVIRHPVRALYVPTDRARKMFAHIIEGIE